MVRLGLFLKIISACFLFFVFCLSLFFIYYAKDLPRPEVFTEKSFVLPTKIYDREGKTLLYQIYDEEKRTIVSLDQVRIVVFHDPCRAVKHPKPKIGEEEERDQAKEGPEEVRACAVKLYEFKDFSDDIGLDEVNDVAQDEHKDEQDDLSAAAFGIPPLHAVQV